MYHVCKIRTMYVRYVHVWKIRTMYVRYVHVWKMYVDVCVCMYCVCTVLAASYYCDKVISICRPYYFFKTCSSWLIPLHREAMNTCDGAHFHNMYVYRTSKP